MGRIVKDIKLLIKGAILPEQSETIYLDQGVVAEVEALERQRDAVGSAPATLEGSPKLEIDRQIDALKAQMADSSIEIRFRALPRTKYTQLMKQHPPREGDKFDARMGFDTDTFFATLIRESHVAPDLDDDDWRDLLGDGTAEHPGVLSTGQFDKLAWSAYGVNRRDVDVPFSPADSQRLATSALGSKQPSDSASASNASTDGSPEPQPATTTTGEAV